MHHHKKMFQRTQSIIRSLLLFSCPEQLKRWLCHSMTESLNHLHHKTFYCMLVFRYISQHIKVVENIKQVFNVCLKNSNLDHVVSNHDQWNDDESVWYSGSNGQVWKELASKQHWYATLKLWKDLTQTKCCEPWSILAKLII